MKHLLLAFLLLNLFGFLIMWWDKRRARLNGRRVPEKTIFLVALFGGSPGCWMGMRLFRHKTQHWRFSLGLPAIMLLQAGLLVYLFIL
jgi:uncharacterized membrane protein YsdA (DUF1294 family)